MMHRIQYAKDLNTLAEHLNEINRQARSRNVTQWRVVAVVRDEEAKERGGMWWCAFMETDRDE